MATDTLIKFRIWSKNERDNCYCSLKALKLISGPLADCILKVMCSWTDADFLLPVSRSEL